MQSSVPCGARYEVKVVDPQPHPEHGCTSNHDVRVHLTVYLPQRKGVPFLPPHLLDTNVEVLGESLNSRWGCERTSKETSRLAQYEGPAIAPLIEQARAAGDTALAVVQAVADRHACSVAAQESARAAAYAACPVADG